MIHWTFLEKKINRYRQKQELELKRQQLEVESKKQENFMQTMLNQQQQQRQSQMQDFQAMMSVQTKQQNDLMLALVSRLIIYMKKLLDSDWLRAVQLKCNTSAKSVTPVQKV